MESLFIQYLLAIDDDDALMGFVDTLPGQVVGRDVAFCHIDIMPYACGAFE